MLRYRSTRLPVRLNLGQVFRSATLYNDPQSAAAPRTTHAEGLVATLGGRHTWRERWTESVGSSPDRETWSRPFARREQRQTLLVIRSGTAAMRADIFYTAPQVIIPSAS
nr:hypothetical protein CFP56_69070 [Quercus suber]